MINEYEREEAGRRLGRNKDVGRLKEGLHRWQGSKGGSDKELASTSASIPSLSNLVSLSTKTRFTNHRRNTYTVTRKYLRAGSALPKVPSQQDGRGAFP